MEWRQTVHREETDSTERVDRNCRERKQVMQREEKGGVDRGDGKCKAKSGI